MVGGAGERTGGQTGPFSGVLLLMLLPARDLGVTSGAKGGDFLRALGRCDGTIAPLPPAPSRETLPFPRPPPVEWFPGPSLSLL